MSSWRLHLAIYEINTYGFDRKVPHSKQSNKGCVVRDHPGSNRLSRHYSRGIYDDIVSLGYSARGRNALIYRGPRNHRFFDDVSILHDHYNSAVTLTNDGSRRYD